MLNMTKKYSVLVINSDFWACGRERIIKPYTKIIENYDGPIKFEIMRPGTDKIEFNELLKHDAVLFQRPTAEVLPKVFAELQRLGKKVVVEIDDRLECVHRDNVAYRTFHPGSKLLKSFFDCLMIADAVHVSTPELADAYKLKNKNRNIHVFYNAIDFDDPVYNQPKKRDTKGYPEDQVNIMWAGSSSHWDSIKLIRGVIEPVILRNEKSHLIIMGNKEFYDAFNLPKDRKTYIQGIKNVNDFPPYISNADIALAPVVPSPFNNAKSELKILEAGIWSIPCVTSDVAPYKRFNALSGGANLMAKKNRPIYWQKHLETLINDKELRLELGKKSYEAIKEHYNLDVENQKRIEFWHDLFGIK